MEEAVKTAVEIWPELLEKLQQKQPELVPIYMTHYENLSHPSPEVRLHAAVEILRAAALLGIKRYSSKICIRLPGHIKAKLEQLAEKKGLTVSQLIREIIVKEVGA